MLTPKERQTLQVIENYLNNHEHAPTAAEIAEQLGIRSTGVVHRYVHALAEKGYLALNKRRHRGIRLLHGASPAQLPLLGRIAAGSPLEAIEDQQQLSLPSHWLQQDCFALQVSGDSMVEAGILDGDYVICQRGRLPQPQQIVAALIDNQEVTLKYWQINHDGSVTLLPANAKLKPQRYLAERVSVQGVLVGQLRDLG